MTTTTPPRRSIPTDLANTITRIPYGIDPVAGPTGYDNVRCPAPLRTSVCNGTVLVHLDREVSLELSPHMARVLAYCLSQEAHKIDPDLENEDDDEDPNIDPAPMNPCGLQALPF